MEERNFNVNGGIIRTSLCNKKKCFSCFKINMIFEPGLLYFILMLTNILGIFQNSSRS